MFLDADLLLNYQRCSRRAFLDVYGKGVDRDPPNDYLLKILQDSRANHRSALSDQAYRQPDYPPGSWEAGAQATLALMQQGVDRIYQGILLVETEGLTLRSQPDLLVKQPGQSLFGDWMYVPTEIKLGKRPKLEYQIVAAFHTHVLAQVQGAWAEEAWLILRDRGEYAVDLWETLPRMQEILSECIQVLKAGDPEHPTPREPEVFISRSRCSLCHWFSYCYAIAKADQHLSLLPGVTSARYVQLQRLNLLTVKALAETHPTVLEPLPGFGREAAHRLVRQARSVLQNQAFLIDEDDTALTPPAAPASLTPNYTFTSRMGLSARRPHSFLERAELPIAPVELYFDIEAEPALNLVYLHGVLVVDRLNQTQVFHPLLAESPDAESEIWQQFLDLVWMYPSAPIFHFCPFEVQTVERLAKLYETPTQRIEPLLPRFVDLHDRVTRFVTLPVESYALKPIARWLGFEWRNPSGNGTQAIYWYDQWCATGDRQYLEAIVDYNEDDCRATYHVKEWLVNFLATMYVAERA